MDIKTAIAKAYNENEGLIDASRNPEFKEAFIMGLLAVSDFIDIDDPDRVELKELLHEAIRQLQ